jgi:hypothetical protein
MPSSIFDFESATVAGAHRQVPYKMMESAQYLRIVVRFRIKRTVMQMMHVEIRRLRAAFAVVFVLAVAIDHGLKLAAVSGDKDSTAGTPLPSLRLQIGFVFGLGHRAGFGFRLLVRILS